MTLSLILGVACLAGCAKPMYVLDLGEGLDRWKAAHPAPRPKTPRTFEAEYVGGPSMGVLNGRMVVVNGAGDDAKDDFRSKLDGDSLAAEGVLFTSFGEAAQYMLVRHLQAYFADVRITMAPLATPDHATVSPTFVAMRAGVFTRSATVQMSVAPLHGPGFSIVATPRNANAAAHLAWIIPVLATTTVAAVPFIKLGLAGIYKGMEKDKLLEAIDLETAAIARQTAHDQGIFD